MGPNYIPLKKIIAFACVLFLIQYSHAQERDSPIGVMWDFPHRDSLSVFAPKAIIRNAPATNATIIDSLPLGTWLKVLETKDEDLKLVKASGYHSYWLPVQYSLNGERKKGFVWSGALAITDNRFDNKRLMVGMGYVSKDSSITSVIVRCKLLDNTGNELWKKDMEIGSEAISLDTKVMNGMGLSNVQNIFRIMSSGEACGIPTDYNYFAWMGDSAVALPKRYCVSDAGIFYYDEAFVFPSEQGGKPDRIIKKIESAEYDDNYKPIKKKREQYSYVWDGKNAVRDKQ